jgi:DNA-binding IscR family transcriptional regulator
LTRPPQEISLADVIRVVDPGPSQRFDATGLAPSPAVLAVRAVWQEMHAEEQRMLERVTLAELVRQTAQTNAPSYQI